MKSSPLVVVVPKEDRRLLAVRNKADVKRAFKATSLQGGRDYYLLVASTGDWKGPGHVHLTR